MSDEKVCEEESERKFSITIVTSKGLKAEWMEKRMD